MIWPHGDWQENHENLAGFVSAGIRAVREFAPTSAVMLHLDCGGNNTRCREWFDTYMADGGEVSMGFTMEDYGRYEKLSQKERKGMATKPHLAERVEYPMTPKGQADFMQELMERVKEVSQGRGKGFYYWEPTWIPLPGCGWANEYSLKYIRDPGPGGNEWANQALFDYDGNALPALQIMKEFR